MAPYMLSQFLLCASFRLPDVAADALWLFQHGGSVFRQVSVLFGDGSSVLWALLSFSDKVILVGLFHRVSIERSRRKDTVSVST